MELSPGDRHHARLTLEKGWLTIDDVAACKEAVEKSGLPFLDVARAKGLLSPERVRELGGGPASSRPPGRMPLPYFVLLILAGVILIGSEVYLRIRAERETARLEAETSEMRRRAEEAARTAADEVRKRQADRDREKAERLLRDARYLRMHGEEVLARNPSENLEADWRESQRLYTLYLEYFPADADALFERAKVLLYRGAIVEAQKDLESACRADAARAEEFRRLFGDLRRRFQQ